MTLLTSGLLLASDGVGMKVGFYRLKNVSNGDTFDVGADFKKVLSADARETSSASAQFTITTGIAGTVITFTSASLANDTVYVMVLGPST